MLEARDVGSAIRKLRGERSQASLAKEVGISPPELQGYEEGEEMPPQGVLIQLINALGISEPEFDLRIIDYWRCRIGEALPQSLEGKRLELFEHLKVIGLRLKMMVRTLDDMASLGMRKHDD